MRISTQTRYAIRLLLELALTDGDARLTTEEIAKRQGISEKYLESIAAKLKKAGIIDSAKGVNGGYRLIKPAEEITAGSVMRLMETTYFEIHCVSDPDECCPKFKGCALAAFWGELEEVVSRALDAVTVMDFVQRVRK